MKNVTISVNEKEFKELKNFAKKNGKSVYATVKKPVKELIKDLMEDKSAVLCLLTCPMYYALAVAVYILV